MASRADQGDSLQDLLTCSICLETYKDPRYLPCLHTLCKSCIHTFILSSKETVGGFPCPVCRKMVHDIAPTEGKEAGADSLPVNHFIVSLLEKQAIKRSEKVCNACDIYETKNKAVSWCIVCNEAFCGNCEKFHRAFKMTSGHKIVSICDMQERDDFKTSEIVCKDHPAKNIEVYCVDHSKACCTLCATLSHRKCDKVIAIEEAAKGVRTGEDRNKLLEQINVSEKILDEVTQMKKQNLTDIETESDNISSTISKMKREMIKRLNNIESELQTELVATRKQLSLQVTDDVDRFQSQQSALVKWKTLLQGVLDHGSDQQCLVTLNNVKEKVEILNIELKEALHNVRHVSIQYNVIPALADFCDTVKSYGNIEVKENKINIDSTGIGTLETDFHSGEIKILCTVNVNTTHLSGIFFADDILLTEFKLKAVKKYTNELNFISKLQVPSALRDIDVINNTSVVVSSDGARELYIINGINMTLLNTLPLPYIFPWGVCNLSKNQLIVGSGTTLTWIDVTSGAKIKSITTCGESYYVSSTNHNNYITGDGSNSVSCVVNGTKKFTYTNNELRCPRGVGIDCHGNMYIAGYWSKNIHQITPDGKIVRIIPAAAVGVTFPWTIRFKQNSNRFVVTCGNSGKATLCEIA